MENESVVPWWGLGFVLVVTGFCVAVVVLLAFCTMLGQQEYNKEVVSGNFATYDMGLCPITHLGVVKTHSAAGLRLIQFVPDKYSNQLEVAFWRSEYDRNCHMPETGEAMRILAVYDTQTGKTIFLASGI